jgi:hypothetical protein
VFAVFALDERVGFLVANDSFCLGIERERTAEPSRNIAKMAQRRG